MTLTHYSLFRPRLIEAERIVPQRLPGGGEVVGPAMIELPVYF
jgi:hypothetical protein